MSLVTKIKRANVRLNPGHLFYAPEWLVLGVNNLCNLKCKMCDVGVGYTESNFSQNLVGSKPLNMPIELFRKIIDQAEVAFPKTKIGYAFTEPLVYPSLAESIQYASSKGFFTSVTTNALTLPTKAQAISEAGLSEIYISLDGLEETHNFIRGHKSSFAKAVEGIEKLLTLSKRPTISIFSVITEWNFRQLYDFLEFFKKYPLKEIGFMHTVFTPDELAEEHNKHFGALYPATLSNMKEIDLNKIDLNILSNEVAKINNSTYPFKVSFSPNLNSPEQLEQFYLRPREQIGTLCNDAFRNIMIKTNGDVIPAHGRCFNLRFGNLYESPLPEIWNSGVASRFRKDLVNAGGLFPACSRCCSAF
jgi:MoaA/NifB/PqqE/SkfB family radical SAM enzyme